MKVLSEGVSLTAGAIIVTITNPDGFLDNYSEGDYFRVCDYCRILYNGIDIIGIKDSMKHNGVSLTNLTFTEEPRFRLAYRNEL